MLFIFSLHAHAKLTVPVLEYNGRIDFTQKGAAPRLIWQGTLIKARFSGAKLALGFEGIQGAAFFDVTIDGKTTLLKAKNGWIDIPFTSHHKKHKITLVKRTEASVGHVGFLGIKTQGKVAALHKTLQPMLGNAVRFMFYGDSITAGACNEDGANDQWENFATHNGSKSYAALTAALIGADYRNISVSGMGISAGYQPYITEQVWNRLYPNPQAPLADVSNWQADVVFLNFGENDDSFTHNQQVDFPIDYAKKYIQLVRDIRKTYPGSAIVILRGGMYGGAKSKRLRTPWEHVVKVLEGEDKNVHHFVFEHWSNLHPRVSDHKKMALELVAWVNKNNIVKKYGKKET